MKTVESLVLPIDHKVDRNKHKNSKQGVNKLQNGFLEKMGLGKF